MHHKVRAALAAGFALFSIHAVAATQQQLVEAAEGERLFRYIAKSCGGKKYASNYVAFSKRYIKSLGANADESKQFERIASQVMNQRLSEKDIADCPNLISQLNESVTVREQAMQAVAAGKDALRELEKLNNEK
ncbi:hypothetical protein [Aromatoleum petrolei]|uniref:Secreted protein n=1 Tax=Aromatoleum petrolei TaxID=76116 RepID=A0ABX1MRW6_9RHOO|nr:hypothetical protein [Aromatoleum petrolei]NMF90722.1 hypothetical protein [Aromatoleum petrolei]QTQ38387.1 Uncharacterized protein ToN1_42880 [Aromatoleum petrolei]